MSLSPEEVMKVAHLARLQIESAQAEQYAGELSRILEMVDQLQQAQVGEVPPMAHPLHMTQRLRPDEVTETDRREVFQSVAPAVEDGLYLVPKVIE